ncbi:MAG TPA: TolC family protein [bacterium]|nr:TolC family protein [bacterium]HPS28712.1 TolC family protein [bacterium]
MRKISWIFFPAIFLFFSLSAEVLDLETLLTESVKNSETVKAQISKEKVAVNDRKKVAMNFFPKTSVEVKLLELVYTSDPEPIKIDISGLMPLLEGSINQSSPIQIDLPDTVPPIEKTLEMPDHQRTLDLTLIQPVTQLWEIYQGYKARDLKAGIEKLKTELSSEKIKREVRGYYYTYSMLGEVLKLIEESEHQLDRYEVTATSYYNSGLIDLRPVNKIKVERAALAIEKEKYVGARSVIKTAISLIIERDENSFEIKSEPPVFNKIVSDSSMLAEEQKNTRIEMKMIKKNDEIRGRLDKVAVQSFIPQLGFTLGFKQNWDPTVVSPEGIFFVGGVLKWDFGIETAKSYFDYQMVKAESVATKLDNARLIKDMTLQIKKLHSDISVLEKTIELNQVKIESATENLRIEEGKYEKQMTTETDLLNASLMVRIAKTEEISSLYRHMMAMLELSGITSLDMETLTQK